MTGVAALPVMSLPDIAAAMPKAGDSAPGTDSIFDDLLAALAPIVSNQQSVPAPAATQPEPSAPTGASDAAIPQLSIPDPVASLETALDDAMAALQLPLPPSQSSPAKPDTVLATPKIADSAGLPPQPQAGNIASTPPRSGSSEPGAALPPNMDASSDGSSLAALTMISAQVAPAGDVPAAPVNPPAIVLTITNAGETPAPNPLPALETNSVPQKADPSATPANPTGVTSAKSDTAAIPAQAAIAVALSQGASAVAPLPSKSAPSSAAEKPAANSVVGLGKTEAAPRASKNPISTAVAQDDNAATPQPNSDSSATAGRTPGNSHSGNETASRSAQDLAPIVVPPLDNLASPASNGYASATAANHAPIELSGITAVNASWAGTPQTGDVPMRLVLTAAGVVPDPASVDALALRIAAKSADLTRPD